ncbi:MAG TPA: 16S rRNA (cytosine(967)-C(5))-methyltransferase RsmB, partial [Casimicrobiaceae bacterium]|nr:16S rRNA (cytosine(967)-C(5))-methyltransferase RsmB [Casimicrobiaceae bacterium]
MHVEQQQAARAVHAVLGGVSLRSALLAVDDGKATRGRTLVAELAYGTLRHYGTLDAIARRLAAKPISDPLLGTLLCVALYQIAHTRAPPFAVVDRAVDAAAALVRPAAKSWTNALLRRYLRERAALDSAVRGDPVARWSYPRWWIARVKADHPACWTSILEAGNVRPPLTLRANSRVGTRDDLRARLAAEGIATAAAGEQGIVVTSPVAVDTLPGYADGAFSVQDLGAQLAAPLLDVADGMRVLDACAAPGGKTTHLLELADLDLTAVDSDAARLARIRENLVRLRLGDRAVDIVEGDAGAPGGWWDRRPYDRVLADVPCTASGVVRRHPDAKWLRRAADVAAFGREQDRVLEGVWP